MDAINITVPVQYMKTATRVMRGLPSVYHVEVDEDKSTLSPKGLRDDASTEWTDTFLHNLPAIDAFLKAHDKERNPNRAYEHVLSKEEFIVLVNVVGMDKCEQIFKLISDDNNSDLADFLDTEETYAGKGVEEFIENYFLKIETDYLQRRDDNFKYGDVIRHEFFGYRNEGVYLYNGHQAVELAWEPDEYGSVPESFPAITQFPPQYFSDSIEHNSFIWLPKGVCYNVVYENYLMGSGLFPEVEEIADQPDHGYEVEIFDNVKYAVLTVNNQCDNKQPIYVVIVYTYESDRDRALAELTTTGRYGQYFNSPNLAIIDVQVYEGSGNHF
jgi:hypothetical protein